MTNDKRQAALEAVEREIEGLKWWLAKYPNYADAHSMQSKLDIQLTIKQALSPPTIETGAVVPDGRWHDLIKAGNDMYDLFYAGDNDEKTSAWRNALEALKSPQGNDTNGSSPPAPKIEIPDGLEDAINGNGNVRYFDHRRAVEMDEKIWNTVCEAAIQLLALSKGGK